MSAVVASIVWMAACEQQTEVQRQTHDLQEAQKEVAKVTQQLESDLATSRAEVARLEQKLAMARQGLTDDVLENQKELQEALRAQEQNVNTEIGQAQREAEIHRRDTEAALKALAQSPAAPEQPNAAPPAAEPVDGIDRERVVPVKGGPDAPLDLPANPDTSNVPTPAPSINPDTTAPAPGTAPNPNSNGAADTPAPHTANPNSSYNRETDTPTDTTPPSNTTPPTTTPPTTTAPTTTAPTTTPPNTTAAPGTEAPPATTPPAPAPEAPPADPNAPH